MNDGTLKLRVAPETGRAVRRELNRAQKERHLPHLSMNTLLSEIVVEWLERKQAERERRIA